MEKLIKFALRHPTAAPVITLTVLLSGLVAALNLNTQVLPPIELNSVVVETVWPGASADEITDLILEPLEAELRTIDNVLNSTFHADAGAGNITIEFEEPESAERGFDEANVIVDAFDDLPADAARLSVKQRLFRETVARLIVYSDADPLTLFSTADHIEDVLRSEGLGLLEIAGKATPEIELRIDVDQAHALGLTASDIANQVRQAENKGALGTTAGSVRTAVTADNASLNEVELAKLTLTTGSGEAVRLSSLSTIVSAVPEDAQRVFFNGLRAVEIVIYRPETMSIQDADRRLIAVTEAIDETLGNTISFAILDRASDQVNSRLSLMLSNVVGGTVLVMALLWLALGRRTAFATISGIVSAAAGALIIMWMVGQTVDMVTTFGFAIIIGMLVDDALMVNERTHAHYRNGKSSFDAARAGAYQVWRTVSVASLTTVIAFAPLMFATGFTATMVQGIFVIVFAALLASFIECFFILPHRLKRALDKGETLPNDRIFGNPVFVSFLERMIAFSLRERGLVIALSCCVLLVSVAMVTSGRLPFVFFPKSDWDKIIVDFSFASNTTPAAKDAMANEVRRAVAEVEAAISDDDPAIQGAIIRVGYPGQFAANADNLSGRNVNANASNGGAIIMLNDADERDIGADQIARLLRETIRPTPGVSSLRVRTLQGGPPGDDLEVLIEGGTAEARRNAALALQQDLTERPGILSIHNNTPIPSPEVDIALSEEGARRGFTLGNLSRQIRSSIVGDDVASLVRHGEIVDIVAKLEAPERSIRKLSSHLVRASDGTLIPLRDLVDLQIVMDFGPIRGRDGKRITSVVASLNHSIVNPGVLFRDLQETTFNNLRGEFGVNLRFGQKSEDQARTARSFTIAAAFAILLICALFVIVLGSPARMALVVCLLPFAMIGPVFAHMVLGFSLSFLSISGFIGLFGVLVNDTLLMVQGIDTHHPKGAAIRAQRDAAITAGVVERAPAVLLTSATTFVGLLPLLIEESAQAQFLIPIALSLGFGLLTLSVLSFTLFPALASFISHWNTLSIVEQKRLGGAQVQ